MRAILINPYNQTVTEVDTNGRIDGETGFYELLGSADRLFSNMVELVRLDKDVDLWIDEEGCLADGRPVFAFQNGPVFAGAALLLSNDGMGDSKALPAFMTLDLVRRAVMWTDMVTTGDFGPGSEGEIDHPVFGKVTQICNGDPVYRQARGYGVYVQRLDGTWLETAIPFATRSDALAWAANIKMEAIYEVREVA